jgi:hypothetical protein
VRGEHGAKRWRRHCGCNCGRVKFAARCENFRRNIIGRGFGFDMLDGGVGKVRVGWHVQCWVLESSRRTSEASDESGMDSVDMLLRLIT